jgi:hypothetical protein
VKLVFIHEDEAWFWVWNEDTEKWEAWYECGAQPAVRVRFSDRPTVLDVTDMISNMARTVQWAMETTS